VRSRTEVTKGPRSRAAGLAMALELIESAEDHWRSLDGARLVALVCRSDVPNGGVGRNRGGGRARRRGRCVISG
jgi:hypothetical protein